MARAYRRGGYGTGGPELCENEILAAWDRVKDAPRKAFWIGLPGWM
jgi:hypothetical protein